MVVRNYSKLRKCQSEITKANIIMRLFGFLAGMILPIPIIYWENVTIRIIMIMAFISVLMVGLYEAMIVRTKQAEYHKLRKIMHLTIIPH